jgi:hypothetical protein
MNKVIQFTANDGDNEKLLYTPSTSGGKGVIKNLTISTFLPSLPLLTTPQKGLLSLAEEWDERYAEFVKAGKHRRLGIYFKYPNSPDKIRRFGINCFNKSPAEDIDLLAMLVTRPKNLNVDFGVEIIGKVESGTYGILSGEDTISVWIDAVEVLAPKQSKIVSLWG